MSLRGASRKDESDVAVSTFRDCFTHQPVRNDRACPRSSVQTQRQETFGAKRNPSTSSGQAKPCGILNPGLLGTCAAGCSTVGLGLVTSHLAFAAILQGLKGHCEEADILARVGFDEIV